MSTIREDFRKDIAQDIKDPYEQEQILNAVMRQLRRRIANGGKRCSKCRQWLPMTAFGDNRVMRDGRDNLCRECRRAVNKG